jgi:hypothetical protein
MDKSYTMLMGCKIQIVKMWILPKVFNKFKTILIRIKRLLVEIDKLILKFICKTILEKKNKLWGIILCNFKTCSKVSVVQTLLILVRDRSMDQNKELRNRSVQNWQFTLKKTFFKKQGNSAVYYVSSISQV